jgi:hypothetical protein
MLKIKLKMAYILLYENYDFNEEALLRLEAVDYESTFFDKF